nr:unnamed protein product [Callosobruchus analis]
MVSEVKRQEGEIMVELITIRNTKQYKETKIKSSSKSKVLLRFASESVDCRADHFISHIDETKGGALSSR